MSQRNLLILLLAVAISYACHVRGEKSSYARYVAEGLTTIQENALEQVPDRELFEGAMRGMVDVLKDLGDKHSEFLDQEATESLRSEIRQQFGGIGVRIGFEGEPPRLTIIGPPEPGSPAARENLRAGDQILAIDGRATDGVKMNDVLTLMRGMPDTRLRLLIQRSGEPQPRDIELVRKVINIESVLGDRRGDDGSWRFLLESDPRIAHVRVTSFGERTAEELERVLASVIARGAKAVLLDLRGDAGGSLDAAVDVCQMLLPAGKRIVETRGQNGEVLVSYSTTEDGPFVSLPLVVLVNQDSASASEIVAACLQDNHRAAIAGQRSYGKGTVQQLVPMQNGKSTLKLTWASFWRPTGAKIHRDVDEAESGVWGVVPDDGLERRLTNDELARYYEFRNERDRVWLAAEDSSVPQGRETEPAEYVDVQLQMAVEFLQSKLDDESRRPLDLPSSL
jgi:carboxyl-terminal processing protease